MASYFSLRALWWLNRLQYPSLSYTTMSSLQRICFVVSWRELEQKCLWFNQKYFRWHPLVPQDTHDRWPTTGLLLTDGKLPSIDHLCARSTNWFSWKRTISCGIFRSPGFGQMVIGQRLKPPLLKPSKQIPIGFWFSLLSFSSWILLCLGFPLGLGPFTSRAHQSFHRDFHPDSARQCNTV